MKFLTKMILKLNKFDGLALLIKLKLFKIFYKIKKFKVQ